MELFLCFLFFFVFSESGDSLYGRSSVTYVGNTWNLLHVRFLVVRWLLGGLVSLKAGVGSRLLWVRGRVSGAVR